MARCASICSYLEQGGRLHALCQRLLIQHSIQRCLMEAHVTRAAHGVQRHARNRVEQRERLQKIQAFGIDRHMNCACYAKNLLILHRQADHRRCLCSSFRNTIRSSRNVLDIEHYCILVEAICRLVIAISRRFELE
jgi:hypothetical protein